MTIEELTKEVVDLRQRLSLAESRLAQQAGQFEFITSQLRDVQPYMHARFDDIDKCFSTIEQRFDALDQRFDKVEVQIADLNSKVDALPRVIAELIAKR